MRIPFSFSPIPSHSSLDEFIHVDFGNWHQQMSENKRNNSIDVSCFIFQIELALHIGWVLFNNIQQMYGNENETQIGKTKRGKKRFLLLFCVDVVGFSNFDRQLPISEIRIKTLIEIGIWCDNDKTGSRKNTLYLKILPWLNLRPWLSVPVHEK